MLHTLVTRSKRSQRREDTAGTQPEIQNKHYRARSFSDNKPLVDVMARKQDIESIAQTRETLAKAGLRSTAARTAVLQWLQKSKTPATHAEISVDLVPLGFDKATVFRNLNDLAEAGLVSRTELGDHVWRFELRDADHEHGGQHPHFVCVRCGQVTCLHELDLPKSTLKQLSQVGKVTEILVRGHCLTCS